MKDKDKVYSWKGHVLNRKLILQESVKIITSILWNYLKVSDKVDICRLTEPIHTVYVCSTNYMCVMNIFSRVYNPLQTWMIACASTSECSAPWDTHSTIQY